MTGVVDVMIKHRTLLPESLTGSSCRSPQRNEVEASAAAERFASPRMEVEKNGPDHVARGAAIALEDEDAWTLNDRPQSGNPAEDGVWYRTLNRGSSAPSPFEVRRVVLHPLAADSGSSRRNPEDYFREALQAMASVLLSTVTNDEQLQGNFNTWAGQILTLPDGNLSYDLAMQFLASYVALTIFTIYATGPPAPWGGPVTVIHWYPFDLCRQLWDEVLGAGRQAIVSNMLRNMCKGQPLHPFWGDDDSTRRNVIPYIDTLGIVDMTKRVQDNFNGSIPRHTTHGTLVTFS